MFVSDTAGYVPLPPRSRPGLTLATGPASSPSSNGPKVLSDRIGTSSGSSGPSATGANDLTAAGLDWRHQTASVHENWDREYRRFRFNNTKVQRKYKTKLGNHKFIIS